MHGSVVPVITQSGPARHGAPNSSTRQSVPSQFRPSVVIVHPGGTITVKLPIVTTPKLVSGVGVGP